MEKLLIVDGNNLLFQMFYGMPARITAPNGKAIHGTLGFIGALLKILRRVSPSHAVVLFDGEHANPRTELDENYKANREDFSLLPEEETPFSQLPDIYAALCHLGISYAETIDCETDDWIAAYTLAYREEMDVVISSFDSDFFQLIDDHVQVLRYRGEQSVLCDTAYLQDKLSIQPWQYADFKALTGDTADNIRGAEKVGPKTAAALLNQFGTLENLLQNIPLVEKPSVRRSLTDSAARLERNYQLIHLTGHDSLPFPLSALTYTEHGATTSQVLTAIGLR